MFDASVYNTILQAAHTVLRNNVNRLSQPFCEGFMFDHDLSNGVAAQQNAQRLLNYVSQEAQRANGQLTVKDDEQLFAIVGSYITSIFSAWQNRGGGRPQQQGFGGGFNTGGGFNGGSMFSNQRNSMFGAPRPGPGSHFADDVVAPVVQPTAQPAPVAPAAPLNFAPAPAAAPISESVIKYVNNPLDDFPDNAEFSAVPTRPTWGDDKPNDRRIVIGKREDLKAHDSKFQINRSMAFHQLILNDPMDVVNDFFDIVPDATLGTPFMFKIGYNHLDIIDVPTADFAEIRKKCIEGVANDHQTFIHKKVIEVLNTMQRGPWKAMTSYLVDHINRALWLACRLSDKPKLFIKISDFEDLDTLLSSSFHHTFTTHPAGRYALERIVGAAIWNAIVKNSDLMFTGKDIPTHAMQSSPAFPFSIDGVYPNKFAIPTGEDAMAETFTKHMHDHELSKRSYILSNRSVVITNILGKSVLSSIGTDPTRSSNVPAVLLNAVAIPFTEMNLASSEVGNIVPNVSEAYPGEQLETYYNNPTNYEVEEVETYGKKRPVLLPVDQTIFAVQYGVSPTEYLMGLDVFTTIDSSSPNSVLLAKREVSTIKTNA